MAGVDAKWLGELLRTRTEHIATRWIEIVAGTVRGRLTEGELDRQIREILAELAAAADATESIEAQDEATAELRAILAELSRSRARAGFTGSETAISVFALKDAVLEALQVQGEPEALRQFVTFSQLVDQLGLYTFEAYARAREDLIADQAQQLLELSTPVVKLWPGVLAVPLVGTLDSARAQMVMEKLLQALVDTSSSYAIIDITGVPAVDTQVAQHVLKTAVAARLMGAECIISGIRPQIAQTIVALGIEFGEIVTKATLADALMHALRATGTDVVRGNGRQDG